MFNILIAAIALLIGVVFSVLSITTLMLVALVFGVPQYAITKNSYWLRVWLAFDRLFNAFLNGDDKETISSRLGKAIYFYHPPVFGWLWVDECVSWMLSQVDNNHCYKSIKWHVGRPKNYHLGMA